MNTESTSSGESGVPRYQQIASYYRDRILSGVMKPGEEMPSRHEMMELHGQNGVQLGRQTADKVIDVLSAQALIVRRSRKAPVVADRRRHATGLTDRAAAKRATGNALAVNETSRITYVGMVVVPGDIALLLGVQVGDMVLKRARVNMIDGEPATMSTSYYTQEVASVTPELSEPKSIPGGSRELAAERMGSPFEKGEQGIEQKTARLATSAEKSALLLAGTYSVVMECIRVVPLRDGRIVEVAKKVIPGDRPVSSLVELA